MRGNWTAVIVNYNGAVFLESCISAIQRCTLQPAETIVVDNASTDDSLLELNGFPQVIVLPQPVNRGFAGGANAGLDHVETDFALLLNPDVEVEPDFGNELVGAFESNLNLGAAGALLVYPNAESIQHAGGILEKPLLETTHRGYGEQISEKYLAELPIDFATGAALSLRMKAVREVNGFDERFAPVYYEDVDLCKRLWQTGWAVRFLPQLRATHVEGVTLNNTQDYFRYLHQNRLRYALKHLTTSEWNTEFIPAEFERLRHQLFEKDANNWADSTGAGAIDTLLREHTWSADSPASSLLHPNMLLDGVEAIAWASEQAESTTDRPSSRIPVFRWIQNKINQPVDVALARQQEFNRAVAESLRATERIQREQLATVLLFGLLALYPQSSTGIYKTTEDGNGDIFSVENTTCPDSTWNKCESNYER